MTVDEPPVDRRDFLFSAAAAAVASTAVAGTVIAEDEAAATVHAITTAHRRLDATTPSRDLAGPVAAHLRMATGMQAKIWDPVSGQAMAAAVSEVAGLAGWLYWDMDDLGSARRHYRIAVEQAQRASGDSMLTAYMLGSLASFVVVQEGAADEGLALIRHATKISEGERPATGDARKIATQRLTCAVRLRRPDIAYSAVADLPVSMPGGHRKQGALMLLDLACAHVQAQEIEEGLRVATVAVDLAATTRSERVMSRARQFRRTIPAPAPPELLRDFDAHLRAANTTEVTIG